MISYLILAFKNMQLLNIKIIEAIFEFEWIILRFTLLNIHMTN